MQTRSRTVEMPSGLSLPLAFGINTLLIGIRLVALLPERKRQFAKPSLDAIRLNVREVLTVYPRCALVGTTLRVGVYQDVITADLVVQRVEAIAGFCLRFRVQRHLQFLNSFRS